MDQIYIVTRLFNVHDRLTSLHLCETIDEWISNGELTGYKKCFLPYRDSNEKVKGKENQTYEIYKMDCETITNATALVGYFDGPSYDSGIGYEIGYAYILGKPIYLLTSDYFSIASNNTHERYPISRLINQLATVIHKADCDTNQSNYYNNLLALRESLCEELRTRLLAGGTAISTHARLDLHDPVDKSVDYYLDINFTTTESSRLLLNEVIDVLKANNCTYRIATHNNYSKIDSLISELVAAKNILILGDQGFDMDIESSVLQGMASALNKPIWLFTSSNSSLYQSEDFILKKNPMIWHSAAFRIPNINVLNNIIRKGL